MLQIKNTLGGGKPEGMYAWKKLSAQGGDFIDYVVSDKETAYPDGGEKGGYYYEKVVEGLDLSEVGFTKAESGEITCSSQHSFSVPHSLGVPPKVVLLMLTGASSYGKVTILVATRYKNGSNYYYMSKAGTEYQNGGQTISDIFDVFYNTPTNSVKATATDTSVNFEYDSNNNYYFYNGGKYKYLFLR